MSRERKRRNDSLIGWTWLSNTYSAVQDILESGSFSYLQFTLLMNT